MAVTGFRGVKGGPRAISKAASDPNAVAHALLMADLSENAKKAIQMGVDNPGGDFAAGQSAPRMPPPDQAGMQDASMMPKGGHRGSGRGLWK